MRNLSEMQRVIYRHDWLCVAEWANALDELADLTDDQIDGLARNDQKDAFSACNGISLPSGSEFSVEGRRPAVASLAAHASPPRGAMITFPTPRPSGSPALL